MSHRQRGRRQAGIDVPDLLLHFPGKNEGRRVASYQSEARIREAI
jgi:hypothetical protein